MASAEEKALKKEQAAADRELRLAGVVPRQPNFNLDAGKRLYTAWAWIPRLKWVIVISSMVSILSLLAVLVSVYTRPLPRVFLSLPDGTIACGPLSDVKGNQVKRSRDYQALCDRLRPPVGLQSAMAAPAVATEEAVEAPVEAPVTPPVASPEASGGMPTGEATTVPVAPSPLPPQEQPAPVVTAPVTQG